MKTYNIGNSRVKKCWSYIQKEKRQKSEKVFSKVIDSITRDCNKAIFTDFWHTNFDSDTNIIEIGGFKIAYSKYSLRENTYLFSFISEL